MEKLKVHKAEMTLFAHECDRVSRLFVVVWSWARKAERQAELR
jgi:hypothetical protein